MRRFKVVPEFALLQPFHSQQHPQYHLSSPESTLEFCWTASRIILLIFRKRFIMSFKFNFMTEDDDIKNKEPDTEVEGEPPLKKQCPAYLVPEEASREGKREVKDNVTAEKIYAEEIKISSTHLEDFECIKMCTKCSVQLENGDNIYHVDSKRVEERLRDYPEVEERKSDLGSTIEKESDLVPGVYEGGLKVWECSIDLVNYMTSLQVALRGLKVLELGCGAGIPGIWAYMQEGIVTFQDYNWEAIDLVTIPNILLNTPEKDLVVEKLNTRCHCVSGDWTKVQELLLKNIKSEEEKFDMILTSETIYCIDNFKSLHEIMKSLLKQTGTIYLAAKTYYFGVGGGTRQFEEYVQEQKTFNISVCKEFTQGLKREILKMAFVTKTERERN